MIRLEKFTIAKDTEKMSSINRTIRFKPEVFDEIQQLHQATGVSFNKICAQCIEYALKHLDDDSISEEEDGYHG
ncbi:hypothetical protein NE562_12425 [Butyricicoccus faecihominis]|uniref:hypothetical protein n=1 Tax=Butyricicoccus faecihominis TaxID=1712515 RepID=UPI002478BF33|nr:hypothetical protein [Butyricicoccus faecihominis]MCQ5130469.1 hypothetical protein [Butyricicoccus faecihominis]